jgi:hypothetical protein
MSIEPSRDSKPARVPLPHGYRQGVITAITVFLGFSLLFLRFWSFEAPGEWTISSFMAGILLMLAIILEIVALWRSLQIRDDDEFEYRRTLRWFMASIMLLLVSLLLAELAFNDILDI